MVVIAYNVHAHTPMQKENCYLFWEPGLTDIPTLPLCALYSHDFPTHPHPLTYLPHDNWCVLVCMPLYTTPLCGQGQPLLWEEAGGRHALPHTPCHHVAPYLTPCPLPIPHSCVFAILCYAGRGTLHICARLPAVYYSALFLLKYRHCLCLSGGVGGSATYHLICVLILWDGGQEGQAVHTICRPYMCPPRAPDL